jgi:cation:H+ antiporter
MNVHPLALRRDGVVVVAASLLFIVLAWSGALGRWEAALLLAMLTAYLMWAYWTERNQSLPEAEMHSAEAEELSAIPSSTAMIIVALVLGLIMLIGGSQLLLYGAIGLAQSIGISEAVIGLTIVAVGTSLPEMAVSVIAALRRHADVAVGNILGSNIFNVLGILGISAFLQPLPIAARVSQFDQWIMLGSASILLLFLYTGMRLSRWEGAALLGGYAAYIALSFTIF